MRDRYLVSMGRSDILTTNESSVRAHARVPWQEAIRTAIRTVDELREVVGLEAPMDAAAAAAFPVFVPREFAAKMRRGDAHDPLLRQVLPASEELRAESGFVADPLAESGVASAGSSASRDTARGAEEKDFFQGARLPVVP